LQDKLSKPFNKSLSHPAALRTGRWVLKGL
jgi:hypothetical protein